MKLLSNLGCLRIGDHQEQHVHANSKCVANVTRIAMLITFVLGLVFAVFYGAPYGWDVRTGGIVIVMLLTGAVTALAGLAATRVETRGYRLEAMMAGLSVLAVTSIGHGFGSFRQWLDVASVFAVPAAVAGAYLLGRVAVAGWEHIAPQPAYARQVRADRASGYVPGVGTSTSR